MSTAHFEQAAATYPPGPEDRYLEEPVNVCQGAEGLRFFVREQLGATSLVPFFASRDQRAWAHSISTPTINAVLGERCVYLPVQVGDKAEMPAICDILHNLGPKLAGANFTQPHKGDPTAWRELAEGRGSKNYDVVVREKDHRLAAHSFNGVAFRGWWERQGGSFADRSVVVIGLGGAGAPIAQEIADAGPSQLTLIDPQPKEELVAALQAKIPDTQYLTTIHELPGHRLPQGVMVINAAGGPAARSGSGLEEILAAYGNKGNSFVDIRASAGLDILDQAESWGWQSFDGYGMAGVNNWMFASCIAQYTGAPQPSLDDFEDLVQRTSRKIALMAA